MKPIYKTALLLLVALWAAGVATTYASLNIWVDEGVTLLQIAGHLNLHTLDTWQDGAALKALLDGHAPMTNILANLIKLDVHPPLYYMTAELWTRVFGSSPFGLRLLSTAFVAAGAVLFVFWDKNKSISKTALLPLMLMSPTVLFAAGNIRDYGMALFLVLLTFYHLHRFIGHNDPKNSKHFTWAVLSACAAFMTHYFTILVLLPAFLSLIPERKTVSMKNWMTSVPIALATAGLGGVFLKFQLGARPDQYAGFTGFFNEAQGMAVFMTQQLTLSQNTYWLLFSAGIFFISVLTLMFHAKDKFARLHLFSIFGFVALTLVLFWGTDKTIDGSNNRYFVFVLPSVLYGLSYFLANMTKWVNFAAATTVTIISISAYLTSSISVAPWMFETSQKTYEESLDIVRARKGHIIIPGNAWGFGQYINRLDKDDTVLLSNTRQALDNAFQDVKSGQAILLIPATNWDPKMKTYLETKTKTLETCGFEKTNHFLWIKTTQGPCT